MIRLFWGLNGKPSALMALSDMPLDCRSARRATMGDAERTSRRCLLSDAADRGKIA
jgi:hypothetical protein